MRCEKKILFCVIKKGFLIFVSGHLLILNHILEGLPTTVENNCRKSF